MRLGGAPSGGETPLAMGTGNDYAELCDLGPSRWSSSSRGGGGSASAGVPMGGGIGAGYPPASAIYQPSSTASTSRIRSNSFEAEDVVGPYGGSQRIGNSTSSLRGRTGLYYSPPGTSYTIVERERDRPLSPHYYYNTAGAPPKGGSLPNRSSGYLESTALSGGSLTNSARHNGKKRPISPEQVLRMFNTTTSSQSVPTSYHSSNGTRDRGRRSPASSPPSTTHQVSSRTHCPCHLPNPIQLTCLPSLIKSFQSNPYPASHYPAHPTINQLL